jgi:hypothetical protein
MKKITIKKEGILAQFLRTEYKGKKNLVRLADDGWEIESTVRI